MAQLKDLIINGTSRFIGNAFANKISIQTLADSTDNIGTNGQVLKSNGTNIVWGNDNSSGGTVTSVQVQASTPLQSSVSAAQTTTLNTTISFKNQNANLVLAGPASGNAATPTFRSLVAADIPNISKSKISDFPTTMTPSSHSHGNITNDGKMVATTAIANGDKLMIVDSDATADNKIVGTTITFDGSTATKALTQKGTWETFNNYSHPTTAGNKHIPSGGATGQHLVYGGASGTAAWADIPVTSVAGKTGNITLETLQLFGKAYNGSAPITITPADIGLNGSMNFLGIITETLADESVTSPVHLADNNAAITPTDGGVVIDGTGVQYVWSDNKWRSLGYATDYALNTHIHGKINNAGQIITDTNVASGNKIVITDGNNGVSRSNITFGTNTSQYLANNGTWQTAVIGVKGNAESTYRTGNVNITAANIGAATSNHSHGDIYVSKSGDTMLGALTLDTIVGKEDINYGPVLPETAVNGQIFYQTTEAVSVASEILNLVYPVGSIYMSINNVNPNVLFGGTWQQIQDTFLLAAGTSYAAGSTGGEAVHTLTETEMPSHKHWSLQYSAGWNGWPYGTYSFDNYGYIYNWATSVYVNPGAGDYTGYVGGTHLPGTQNTGGGAAHNNMPPYLAVYIWKRTA